MAILAFDVQPGPGHGVEVRGAMRLTRRLLHGMTVEILNLGLDVELANRTVVAAQAGALLNVDAQGDRGPRVVRRVAVLAGIVLHGAAFPFVFPFGPGISGPRFGVGSGMCGIGPVPVGTGKPVAFHA